MPQEFIPRDKAELSVWLRRFADELPAIAAALGFPASFDDELAARATDYEAKIIEADAAKAAYHAAVAAQDQARFDAIAEMRTVLRQLRAHPAFEDAMAARLGVPGRDRTLTPRRARGDLAILLAEPAGSQLHRVRVLRQSEDGGRSRARPSWSRGARLVRAVVPLREGCPPIEKMEFVCLVTAGRAELYYPGDQVGLDVWYRGAWESYRGELGPWSDPARATVAG